MLVDEIKERRYILGIKPERVYGLMFKTVLHALSQAYFPEVESNFLLVALADHIKTLISSMNLLIRRKVAKLSVYLKSVMDFMERTRDLREPLYIILCDSLSLPEYMFLLYAFHRFVSAEKAFCAVNPSGKTATFKYLAKEYLGIEMLPSSTEVTMRNISEGLRKKLGASGASIFRDIDMLIHYGGEYKEIDDMISILFKITNKLCIEVKNWLNNKYKVLILADHGYDVLRNKNVWTLTHKWEKEKLCISPFIPILMMG